MIEFKIMQCPERSQIANYQHLANEITFGSAEGDMIIDDADVAERQVRIFMTNDSFLVENLDPGTPVKLNGQLVEGQKPIKTRDSLTIGRTTVQMSLLDPAPLAPPPPFEHPHADERFVPGSKEEALLTVLKHLAQEGEESPAPLPNAAPPPLPKGMPTPPPLPKKSN